MKQYFSESKDEFLVNFVNSPIPHKFYFLCGNKYVPASTHGVRIAISAAKQVQGFTTKGPARQLGLEVHITFIHL